MLPKIIIFQIVKYLDDETLESMMKVISIPNYIIDSRFSFFKYGSKILFNILMRESIRISKSRYEFILTVLGKLNVIFENKEFVIKNSRILSFDYWNIIFFNYYGIFELSNIPTNKIVIKKIDFEDLLTTIQIKKYKRIRIKLMCYDDTEIKPEKDEILQIYNLNIKFYKKDYYLEQILNMYDSGDHQFNFHNHTCEDFLSVLNNEELKVFSLDFKNKTLTIWNDEKMNIPCGVIVTWKNIVNMTSFKCFNDAINYLYDMFEDKVFKKMSKCH